MRPKPVLFAVAALVVLALALRQVTQAVHRTFGGRPGIARLARATPAYQNGLTLMEIDNVSPNRYYSFSDKGQVDNGGSSVFIGGDTGLWIKLPRNALVPMNCSGDAYDPCRSLLTITARTSDGRRMPLHWRTSNARSVVDPILVSIPAGYPDTVRWADVTLEDHHGDSATWRILNLPPMQHVLAPPVTPQTTFHQGNIMVSARAYRGADPNGNGYGPMVLCDLTGTITNAPNHWDLGPFTLTREWEPPGYVAPGGNMTTGTSKDAKNKVTIQATREAVYYNQSDIYPDATNWVRLGARLQEYATYDETVVFHNLSVVTHRGSGGLYLAGAQPQTATSPSGIVMTLEDVQHQQLHFLGTAGAVSLKVTYPRTRHLPRLAGSPLWRRYKRPVTVSVSLPAPYESYGGNSEDAQETYSFRPKKPLPKVIANFPVIIRQRVDLRAVPMTFTLPVRDMERT